MFICFCATGCKRVSYLHCRLNTTPYLLKVKCSILASSFSLSTSIQMLTLQKSLSGGVLFLGMWDARAGT